MKQVLKKPAVKIGLVIGVVVGLAAAWYLVSPLFLSTEVNDDFPLAASAQIPDDMTIEEVEAEMQKAADAPEETAADDMPDPEPVAFSSGMFAGADDFHQGSGSATIYELDDGSFVLRLADFEVTNGPDLRVLLSMSSDPASDLGEYIELGPLKGNLGNQNYEIPDGHDPEMYQSVIIYCKPFHVLFSSANLSG